MIIVDKWDGPVWDSDREKGYSDIDEAVERIVDNAYPVTDPLTMPEYLECMEEYLCYLDAKSVIESLDNWEGNVHSDDNYASNAVTPKLEAELQTFLNAWCKEVPWRRWDGNGKYVRVRDDIEEYLKVVKG